MGLAFVTEEEVSRNEAASSGHLFVLVFDQLHIDAARAQRVRLAAERFVSREVKPGDAIAIYALPGPGPSLDLTGDVIRARGRLRELRGLAESTAGGLREFDAYRLARSAGWMVTVSVRSGETEDDWAADLAVGWSGDQFKNGSITRSERPFRPRGCRRHVRRRGHRHARCR